MFTGIPPMFIITRANYSGRHGRILNRSATALLIDMRLNNYHMGQSKTVLIIEHVRALRHDEFETVGGDLRIFLELLE
jgi:hypothetical protein